MNNPAAKGAALAAMLCLAASGQSAAQAVIPHFTLRSDFRAIGAPEVLAPMSPALTTSLQAPGLSATLTSALPAVHVIAPVPAAAVAEPFATQRRGGLLGQDHAAVLFAAIPDMSRLGSAEAKHAAESDFVARLGGNLAEPPEPELDKAEVLSLRTTQMAVGMEEVKQKKEKLKSLEKDSHELKQYLKSRPVPVVLGPNGRMYIIDHHHLVRAAWESDVPKVYIEVKSDLSSLSESAFWDKMRKEQWVYPYDQDGKPRNVADLPKDVRGLADDPYRSVAWAVREQGGFKKTDKPFMEFQWAELFRARLKTFPDHRDFEAAVKEAMALAKSPEAKHLPGYYEH